jgi:hypothetical protein
VPVAVIRRRANLPPPFPGQPGPFSLGATGALEQAYASAGFRDVRITAVPAPLDMASAAECVRFEKESFGALHQMLAGLDQAAQRDAWEEIEQALREFEGPSGFRGPCELLIGIGTR